MNRGKLLALTAVSVAAGFALGHFVVPPKVPEIATLSPEGELVAKTTPPPKHDKKLSEVAVPGDAKFTEVSVASLKVLTRFKQDDRLFSVTSSAPGTWSEDLSLGFADGKVGEDSGVYLCRGKTAESADYDFYSLYENCWGEKALGSKPSFALAKRLKSGVYLPLYNCLNSKLKIRYPSLNSTCEAEGDNIQEVLGYVRAAKIVKGK
jgi:hypothetical protein